MMRVRVEIEDEHASDPLQRLPRARQIARMFDILRRFVRPEDSVLTDFDFVKAIYRRVLEDRGIPLIDPNE